MGSTPSAIEELEAPIASGDEAPIGGFGELTRDSLTFGLGSLLGKAAGFVLILILVRLMSPAALGELDVLMSLLNALALLVVLQIDVSTARLYFDRTDPRDRRRLLGTAGAIILAAALVAAGGLALLARPIGVALFGSDALAPAVVAVAVGVLGMGLEAFTLTVLRVTGRPRGFALVEGLSFVTYLVLAPVLLVLWQPNATAVLVGWGVGVGMAAVVGLILVRHQVAARPDGGSARALLGLAAPLVPAALAAVVAEFLNRAILLDRAGSEEVAFLAVGLRFASIATLTVTAFQLALQPRAYRLGASGTALEQTGRDGYRVILAVLALVVLGAVVAPELIPLLAGDTYRGAVAPFGWSLVAAIAGALFLVGSISSALARATRDIALAAGIGAGLGIVGTLITAPVLGAIGTAMAIALGQLVAAAIVIRSGTRHAAPSVPWPAVLGLSGLAVATVLAFTQPTDTLPLGLRLVLGLVVEVALARELLVGRSG